jgi:thiosulfate/3-mercaptopyruvate sulfurtransferase
MSDGYAHPEVLVSTDWVAQHQDDPQVRIVESDEDVLLYETGHIPGAVKIDWHTDEQDQLRRDFVSKEQFAQLCSSRGIANDTTVVFYGDRNNWYATYTFWLFRMYGHKDLRVMNGGRSKWEAEGRPLVRDVPSYPATQYTAQDADTSIRAFRDEVLREYVQAGGGKALVDVRSPQEYKGEVLAMVGYEATSRKVPSAPATSPAPRASPGVRPPTRTAPSRAPRSCARCMKGRRSRRTSRWWRTAASGSAAATPGSCSRTCWAIRT